MEGGDEAFRYAAGLSYNHVAGTMKGSDRTTINGNVFLSYNYKNLTFQNDLQVSNNKAKNSPYGTFSDFSQINSYLKPYDDEGNILKYADNETYATTKTINPLYNALLPYKNETKYTSITDNFSIEWRILPELTARGTFSLPAKAIVGIFINVPSIRISTPIPVTIMPEKVPISIRLERVLTMKPILR